MSRTPPPLPHKMGECCGRCRRPSRREFTKLLKEFCSSASGMVGALATYTALAMTFRQLGIWAAGYAVLVSWLSVLVLGLAKLALEPRLSDKLAVALVQLLKISFCLLSAAAWSSLLIMTKSLGQILGVAIGLTVGLIVVLILLFMLYDAWKARWRARVHRWCALVLDCHLVGFALWTPITFGLVIGAVWNVFFGQLLRRLLGVETATYDPNSGIASQADPNLLIFLNFVYALCTIPLAVFVLLYSASRPVAGAAARVSAPAPRARRAAPWTTASRRPSRPWSRGRPARWSRSPGTPRSPPASPGWTCGCGSGSRPLFR